MSALSIQVSDAVDRTTGKFLGLVSLDDLLNARGRHLEEERRRERPLKLRFLLPGGKLSRTEEPARNDEGNKKLQQASENTLICSKVCAGWSAEKEMLMELIGRASLVCTLILCGCQVSKPGKVESKMMKTVKHNLTVGGKGALNPIAPTADNIADGQEHFGHHCGICHGLDGQGTGVPFAAKMSPAVADLSSKDVQDYTDGQIKWVIENGLDPSGMPAWNGLLSDEEMWKIVDYIRHLPAKGSLGIPDVYKAEQKQHQHMQGEKHHE